jgi:malate synthase
LVRPRGLHLDERHIIINNEKASGSLVDFGLYVFHNTQTMMHETAPYFYYQNRALFRSALVEQSFEFARIFRVPMELLKQLF